MGKPKVDPGTVSFATVAELTALLRQHQISSGDLTEYFLDRLEKIGPQYNAIALSLRKPALQQASDVDDDLSRERFRSPLQGIPYAAKDLLSVEGLPTTWGAKLFENQTFDEDAFVLKKLRRTGAILAAKLAMIELAGGGGYNTAAASLQGPGLNPWDRSRWSGGSSSGSAIAVAAGLVPYALGSETSGSIITPAAYCALSGLRPTFGLVSRTGAMPLSWTCDKIGVLTHTADDCGTVLQAIAGRDDQDVGSAGKSFRYTPNYARPFADLKIGFNPADFESWPDEPLRAVFKKAFDVVRTFGSEVIETALPDFPYPAIIRTIIDSEAASVFQTQIESGAIDQLADRSQVFGLKAALTYSAVDYLRAMRLRHQVQLAIRTLFTQVDILIAPSRPNLPERIDQPFDQQRTQAQEYTWRGVGPALVPAANLCGLPGLSIPCGFIDGLPVGIQFVGPPFSENTLIAFGRTFQSLTDFHRRQPAVAAT